MASTARLECPHCGTPIVVTSTAAAATLAPHFDALERRLRALPSPFRSASALEAARATIGGPPYDGYRLWEEFRRFRVVRRVRPGYRWTLPERVA
jgi:hypothetical protein